jgi:hypothetical protein
MLHCKLINSYVYMLCCNIVLEYMVVIYYTILFYIRLRTWNIVIILINNHKLVIFSDTKNLEFKNLFTGLGDRIPVGARFSAPVQTGAGAHPASCKMGTGSFPEVESGRGVTLTPHPLLVPRSKNRVELYLDSPYGPSWPVKGVKPTLCLDS